MAALWDNHVCGWSTTSTTTWDTGSSSDNLAYISGSAPAKSNPPKRTALDWLDERVDEMREMGRELLDA